MKWARVQSWITTISFTPLVLICYDDSTARKNRQMHTRELALTTNKVEQQYLRRRLAEVTKSNGLHLNSSSFACHCCVSISLPSQAMAESRSTKARFPKLIAQRLATGTSLVHQRFSFVLSQRDDVQIFRGIELSARAQLPLSLFPNFPVRQSHQWLRLTRRWPPLLVP